MGSALLKLSDREERGLARENALLLDDFSHLQVSRLVGGPAWLDSRPPSRDQRRIGLHESFQSLYQGRRRGRMFRKSCWRLSVVAPMR